MVDTNNRVLAASTPGARHSMADWRRDIFQSSGGASGLIAAGGGGVGLTPGTPMSVRLEPCSVRVRSEYPARSDESYSFSVRSPQDVAIRTTGSGGGRTDVVALVVNDPILEGMEVAETDALGNVVPGSTGLDPNAHDYWDAVVFESVPAAAAQSTETFRSWVRDNNRARGGVVPYAKVVQGPDSVGLEGKVTAFYDAILGQKEIMAPIVTDLTRHSVERGPTNGEYWTLGPAVLIEIPDFATHVTLTMEVSGLYVKHSASSTRDGSSGYLRARFLDQNSHVTRWDMDINEGRVTRGSYTVARKFPVPTEMRGTTQPVQMMVTNEYSTTAVGVNSGSTFITNATFEEL